MGQLARILIVDDDPAVRRTLELLMEDEPWEVVSVESAEQGLDELAQARFDVLLVDKNLPGMSGIDLIRTLRDRGDRVPCFVMTAWATADSATEALELGIEAYLEKPFEDIHQVLRRVAAVLEQRSSGEPPPQQFDAVAFFQKARSLLRDVGTPTNGDGLRTLVVCCDGAERQWLVGELRGRVAELVDTGDGRGALEAAPLLRPELAIVDSQLADQDAVELIRALRRQKPDLVVFVIGPSDLKVPELKRFIEVGAQAVLHRPLDAAVLRSKLEQLLRRAAPRSP